MKVTKEQIKQIIREEVDSIPFDNLIGGINGLVKNLDHETVSMLFTTVFRGMGGDPEPEPEPEPESELSTPIGFDRDPEQLSDEPGPSQPIGFRENLRRILEEEIKSDPALLAAIGLLTAKIDDLDVSIDYLAGAVTGQSPAVLGYNQSSLGRFAQPIKKDSPFNEPDRMNEIEQAVRQYLSEIEKQR